MTRDAKYDGFVSAARSAHDAYGMSRISSKDTAAASIIANSIKGLTYAVLALAESGRPEPVRVDVKVNAAEVATKVSEQLGGEKKAGAREDVRQVNELQAVLAQVTSKVTSTGEIARALYAAGARLP
jgi:hypothetical protein